MRYCTKLFRAAFIICLFMATAYAGGISVNMAEMRGSEDSYRLTARYDFNLNFAVQQALTRGVPLYFVGEFSLVRSRWYWLDEEIFRSEHTVKLSYNVLTRQYRISRGALFQNFATYEDALKLLARFNSTDIPASLIDQEGEYIAAARLRLDIEQLPNLLQVNALTSKDWDLSSDWYRWVIRPAEIKTDQRAGTP
ncbi:MAG: DUF4390 domain-containing protein [Pseudomonadota bacterium]